MHLRSLHSMLLALLMLVYWPASSGAQSGPVVATSPSIEALRKSIAAGDREAVQRFWKSLAGNGTPLIEAGDSPDTMRVTFVVRDTASGAATNARLMTYRADQPIQTLENVSGSDLWVRTLQMPRSARAGYFMAWPQGRTADAGASLTFPYESAMYDLIPDSLGRRQSMGVLALGQRGPSVPISWFEGDRAPPESYLARPKPAPAGKLKETFIDSGALAGRRQLTVYTPPGYSDAHDYNLLVLFDAEQYLSVIAAPTLLDNMIADGAIAPVVTVFVAVGDTRNTDLPPNERYRRFLHDELVPWIRKNYAVSHEPARAAVGGFSFGGLAAMDAGLASADVFGNVISQSGAFWWGAELDFASFSFKAPLPPQGNDLSRQFARAARLPLRIYMNVGRWEGDVQVVANRQLSQVLRAAGYDLEYGEFEGGHDVIAWRATLPDALRFAVRPDAVSLHHEPAKPLAR